MSLLSSQVLFSKPDAIANLQGTSCAYTQRIFGILRMNHVSQVNMILKQPGQENVVAQFLPNKLILILQRHKKEDPWLFIWRLNYLNLC